MTKKSEFAETLINALRAAGYKYYGVMTDIESLYSEMHMLSPTEMAKQYAEKFNLAEINIFMKLLTQIQDGTFKMRLFADTHKLSHRTLSWVLHNYELVEVDGLRAKTTYTWCGDVKPIFTNAKRLTALYNDVHHAKLTVKQKQLLDNVLDNNLNVETAIAECAPAMSVAEEFKFRSTYAIKKSKLRRDAEKKPNRQITETVISRMSKDDFDKIDNNIDKSDDLSTSEKPSVNTVKLQMLELENKYLQDMLTAKTEYIKVLETQLRTVNNDQ